MRVALFGLPGAGKGTLAALLQERLGLPQISTGDLLRAAAKAPGDVGDTIRALPVGSFAPDELVLRVLAERVGRADCERGFVLDGFPRTVEQARALLGSEARPDAFVFLAERSERVIERALDRLWHPASGRVYNAKTRPPRVAGLDDETGEPLERRADDRREVLERRCLDFEMKTMPAVEHCRRWAGESGVSFIEAPAGAPLEELAEEIGRLAEKSREKARDARRPGGPL
jgi:adenylate kinase